MSVELACTCDGLPPHDHGSAIGFHVEVREGRRVAVVDRDSDALRIWVDWKAVARDLMVNP